MIALTRFDGTQFYLNADYIIFVEETPDTMVALIDHNKLRVRERAAEVMQRVVAFRQQCAAQPAVTRALLRWRPPTPDEAIIERRDGEDDTIATQPRSGAQSPQEDGH